jgi:hypothetical protein
MLLRLLGEKLMTARPRDLVNPATGQITTTRANRWERPCWAPGICGCDHDPNSTLGSCDHGWTTGHGGKAIKCRRCQAHADANRRRTNG